MLKASILSILPVVTICAWEMDVANGMHRKVEPQTLKCQIPHKLSMRSVYQRLPHD